MILSTIISIVAGGILFWLLSRYGVSNSFAYSLGFTIVVWIIVFAKTFRRKISEEERIRKQYATGFKWGKREHTAEIYTTRVLIVGFLILGSHLYFHNDLVVYISLPIFGIALILRLIAAYCHKQEKKYMDELRFKK